MEYKAVRKPLLHPIASTKPQQQSNSIISRNLSTLQKQ